jgi:hypothetical protein
LAIAGAIFGNGWLEWILSKDFRFEPVAMALIVTAGGGSVVFVLLRSVLDATSSRPRNAIHAFISLAALFLFWQASYRLAPQNPLLCICAATAAAFSVLAGLTLLAIQREFGLRPGGRSIARWTAVQTSILALGWLLHCEPSQGLLRFFGSQLLLAIVWFGVMQAVGARWMIDLVRFLRPRRTAVSTPLPSPAVSSHPSIPPVRESNRREESLPVSR